MRLLGLWPAAALLVGTAYAQSEPAQPMIAVEEESLPSEVAPGESFTVRWRVRTPDHVASTFVFHGAGKHLIQRSAHEFQGAPGYRRVFEATIQVPVDARERYGWTVFARTASPQNGIRTHRDARRTIAVVPRLQRLGRAEGAIPSGSAGVEIPLTVAAGATLDVVGLRVAIEHPDPRRLSMSLRSPRGTQVTVRDRGEAASELRLTLADFAGEPSAGTWTLRAIDHQAQEPAPRRLRVELHAQTRWSPPTAAGIAERVEVRGLRFPRDAGSGPIEVVPAFPHLQGEFERPLFVSGAGDGSERLFVVEQGGRVRVFPNRPDVRPADVSEFLRLRTSSGGVLGAVGVNEQGLLGLCFAPDFASSGALYVYYNPADGERRTRLSRFTVSSSDPDRADPGSEEVLLEVAQPAFNHNGGMLAFGPDGYLYLGLGDGGDQGDPRGNGQNLSTLLGSILRIDPSRPDPARGTAYSIPADNPFVGQADARPEIWAYGLRNPWRFSFAPDGALWIGDVGQSDREEVTRVDAAGANLGWRLFEGTREHANDTGKTAAELGITLPIVEYGRDQARSLIGGYVYRGAAYPALRGLYFHADYATNRVFALPVAGGPSRTVALLSAVSSFGEDDAGELYAVARGEGTLYQVRGREQTGPGIPERLSQTGLFASTADLTPAPGVLPYALNAPLWSDGAHKQRWLALPRRAKIGFDASEAWTFPTDTVLVKHFELDGLRLETRVLIKDSSGWSGYTYRWDDDQLDATLLGEEGAELEVPRIDGSLQTWRFPSRADCLSCHTSAAGGALGPRTLQLNRDVSFENGVHENQLQAWDRIGLFDRTLGDPRRYRAYPNPYDASAPLEHRARAYLAVNCANCHLPGGPTNVDMDLRYRTAPESMQVIGVPFSSRDVLGPDALRIAPGEPRRSVLLDRLSRRDAAVMPPLGTAKVDEPGAALIAEWIRGLEAQHPRAGLDDALGPLKK